jgi:hypothetical protein
MKTVSKLLLLTLVLAAPELSAQEAAVQEFEGRRLSVNIFRAPSNGIDYRVSSHASVHAGFYPTVLEIQGDRENVNFIRLGGTFWLSTRSGPYLSTGVALSLDRNAWRHSFANEAGYHQGLGSRLSVRLGVILLTTTDLDRSSANPTIGLSFRPGTRRAP